jgi:hypothetical protein
MSKNSGPFGQVHNHRETMVFELIEELALGSDSLRSNPQLRADIACIALNALKPRYICRAVNMDKFMTLQEREANEAEVRSAVQSAFEFVVLNSTADNAEPAMTRDL